MTKVITKVWGSEVWLVNEPEYCAKILTIKPGYKCSLHMHKVKKETFIVQSGVVKLGTGLANLIIEYLTTDDSRTIMPGTPHRFSSEEGATILEVSTHHDDSDVVRFTESGKIKETAHVATTQPESL